ncbi:hypothetical protein B0T18DRAFT_408963 [Schizothecium vesticola]|uniref:Uncharacterized protein n=1 Tax=Schizothecium vesticola TaxID=314040 RepID=A0AA40F3M8_9PEZI|nr:hypothetical protein B0T18DRAFT_408963 [Schizothecium vesticola]
MDTIFGGNGSSVNQTSPWQPQPTFRGTFGILSTCLVTLGLCVWSAIHLNMPARNEAPWDFICALSVWKNAREKRPWCHISWPGQALRKTAWALLGFFAPELVAFTAYQQHKTAKSLTRALKEKLSPKNDLEENSPTTATRQNEWTIVHSYFVLMGGYEIRTESVDQNFLPLTRVLDDERKGIRLSPEGFQALAEKFPHLIPDQSRERIEDKSKGDAIAKTLICFQATWFCAQCLARLGQRLGISLLELNTLGHALCAFLIYCLWWNKPLDTKEPEQIFLREEQELQFVASLCARSRLDEKGSELSHWFEQIRHLWKTDRGGMIISIPLRDWENHPLGSTDRGVAKEFGSVPFFPVISCISGSKKWVAGLGKTTVRRGPRPRHSKIPVYLQTEGTRHKVDLINSYLSLCLELIAENTEENRPGFCRLTIPLSESDECQGVFLPDVITEADNSTTESRGKTITVDIAKVNIRRWKLLSEAADTSDLPRDGQYLLDRIRNIPTFDGIREGLALYVGLAITGFVYGGLHCLAWNAPFATGAETLLWRISSVAIMLTFVLVLFLYSWELSPPMFVDWEDAFDGLADFFVDILDPIEAVVARHLDGMWKKWVLGMIRAPTSIFWIFLPRLVFDLTIASAVALYCLARVYLVVECFINLSHLPASVYETPGWSQYVPHIS